MSVPLDVTTVQQTVESSLRTGETGIGGVGSEKVTSKREHKYQRLDGEACISNP